MRDLIVLLVVVGTLPLILYRPYIGILVWSWLGYMNPHRLTWSFAYDMPFAQIVGLTTLVGYVISKDKQPIPINLTTCVWVAFIAWFSLTTVLAIDPEVSREGWEKATKIQFFSILTVLLIRDRHQLNALVWVIAASIGFYGLKGGIFVLTTGGASRVYGPPGSFIGENNAMALALIMTIPLIWYLASTVNKTWLKYGLFLIVGACGIAVLGSHSRGAVLAGASMLAFLLIKSERKAISTAFVLVIVAVGLATMPDHWFERIGTIRTYEQDNSAMGRITAWRFAGELASQRPIGGGFEVFAEENYRRFSPEISAEIDERDGRFQGAHSIYFRVLGEHGFPGLILFLGLGFTAYRRASIAKSMASENRELRWATRLSSLLQASLVGFAVGGAFLGLSYFDLFYHLVAMIVILEVVVRSELEKNPTVSTDPESVEEHYNSAPELPSHASRTNMVQITTP